MKQSAQVAEIVLHYRRKGLAGAQLARRLAAHARLLEALDPAVAELLHDYRVRR